MIIMKSVSVFRREIGENIFLHPVEGKFGRFVFLQHNQSKTSLYNKNIKKT